jgi:uncharacterized membrane-anchored protein
MPIVLGLFAVAAVAVLVVLLLAFLAFGLLIAGVVALAAVALKLLPFLLVGWLAVRLLRGSQPCGTRVATYHARPPVTADDAWLDTRG